MSEHAGGALPAEPPAVVPVATPEWLRFHPLTPLLRGGVMVVAVAGYLLSQQADRIFGSTGEDPTREYLGFAAAAVAAVILLTVLGAWISWRAARYRLGALSVELKNGVVFRQHRQVRYDRIQAVDITRPVLARLVGLSAVKVEAAGGAGSNIELSYLSDEAAQELRLQLLHRAEGRDPVGVAGPSGGPSGTPAGAGHAPRGEPAAEEALVARIPSGRVWVATAMSLNTGFLLIGIPLLVIAFLNRSLGFLPILGPMVLAALGQQVGRFTSWMNFHVYGSPAVIRVRHGLTEVRARTVPVHRIQAVEISQPLLWRPLEWWRIRVNVAGVGPEKDNDDEALIPVGTVDEVMRILSVMGPRWSLPEVGAAMHAEQALPGMVGLPPSARWLDPFSWRRRGYAVTETALVVRDGWLARGAVIIPHARIQSQALDQGPIERRLGLANVHLHSTVGPVTPVVRHLALADALTLANEERARAAVARRAESVGANPPQGPSDPLSSDGGQAEPVLPVQDLDGVGS